MRFEGFFFESSRKRSIELKVASFRGSGNFEGQKVSSFDSEDDGVGNEMERGRASEDSTVEEATEERLKKKKKGENTGPRAVFISASHSGRFLSVCLGSAN